MRIILQQVSKHVGDFRLHQINFTINSGTYQVLLGPTGSGKTLILELLSGFIRPDQGRIIFCNQQQEDIPFSDVSMGIVYQDDLLFPHLTVKDNIAYGLKTKKVENHIINDAIKEIAILCDIPSLLLHYPNQLSGGEKRQVALARALIHKPDIVLLDEPFAALDVSSKRRLTRILKQWHARYRCTICHVTHDFEEAIILSDYLCVLDKGIIVQEGESEAVFRKPASPFVADFVDARNMFQGVVTKKEGKPVCYIDSVCVWLNTQKTGTVHWAIRPEDIILANSRPNTSARNMFQGHIVEVVFKPYICEVTVDVGIPLVAFITRYAYDELAFDKGKRVWVMFKATEVHVF